MEAKVYIEGDIIADYERDLENEARSLLCMRDGYQYHIKCNDSSCTCDCHYEGD